MLKLNSLDFWKKKKIIIQKTKHFSFTNRKKFKIQYLYYKRLRYIGWKYIYNFFYIRIFNLILFHTKIRYYYYKKKGYTRREIGFMFLKQKPKNTLGFRKRFGNFFKLKN